MKVDAWKGVLALVVLLLAAEPALAEVSNSGIMNDALHRFHNAATTWGGAITSAATRLFWALVVISMVWTFGIMALRKADIGEFFAEFVRFTIFTGFFWWILSNAVSGMNIAGTIVDSLQQLAGDAGGLGSTKLGPSEILDLGFELEEKVRQAIHGIGLSRIADALVMQLLALVILVILAIIAVNLLLVLVSAWVLLYAGVFFLGFGGSRWTSDLAIGYYRSVLGIAAQLMGMVLLVAIGKNFIEHYYNQLSDDISMHELGVILVIGVMLLFLVNKIPAMLAGIVSGSAVGSVGAAGSFGAGAMFGAAATAGAATLGGAGLIGSAGTAMAGGAEAVKAAAGKASQNVSAGSDVLGGVLKGANPVSRGVRMVADTMSNLAKGAGGAARDSAASRINQTKGGRIASKIRGDNAAPPGGGAGAGDQMNSTGSSDGDTPVFDDNSLAATHNTDTGVDANSEISRFVQKDSPKGGNHS